MNCQNIDAYTFLKTIHGDNCFEIRLLQDPGGKTVATARSLLISGINVYAGKQKDKVNISFKSNADLERLNELFNCGGIMGVFFTPNNLDFNKMETCTATDDDVQDVVCQFIDIDAPDDIKQDNENLFAWKQLKIDQALIYPVKPSIVVETKNGIHVYYLLSRYGQKDLYRFVQKQLVQQFGGDKKCINLSRVMRMPYFYHIKDYKNPFLVKIVHWKPDIKYTQTYLTGSFTAIKDGQVTKTKAANNNKIKLTNTIIDMDLDEETQKIIDIVRTHLDVVTDKPNKITCRCCLPEHDDRNPSAWFDKENLWYHCSGCGAKLPLQELAKIMGWQSVLNQLSRHDLDITESVEKIQSSAVNVDDIPHLQLTEYEKNVLKDLKGTAIKLFHEVIGQDINDKHESYIEAILQVLLKGQTGEEYLFPLTMGGGKTAVLGQFTVSMSRLDKDFGEIICLEFKKDVEKMTNSINKAIGKDVAYPMYGYEPHECLSNSFHDTGFTRCQYSSNPMFNKCKYDDRGYDCRYYRQKFDYKNYPFLIMTHQRMFMDANVFAEKYKYFTVNNDEFQRTRLLIDEKPKLVSIYHISSFSFDGLMKTAHKRLNNFKARKDFIKEVNGANRMVANLLIPSEVIREEINPIKKDFEFSPELKEYIRIIFSFEDKPYQALEAIEKIIANGCVKEINPTNGKVVLSLGLYKDYPDNKQFSTVIFDGTADLDLTYRHENHHLLNFEPLRTYEDLEFYFCQDISSSRSYFKKIVQSLCREIKNIANKYPDEKIYVPVYKEHKTYLVEELKEYINKSQIKVASFGETRGSNKFKDCSIVIVAGILHKTELFYLSLAKAINGKVASLDTYNDYNRTRRFIAKDVELVKLHDMIVDYSQEIARTSQRNQTENVKGKVFIFTKDKVFLDAIRIKFPGSQVKEWLPKEIIVGKIKSHTNNDKQQMLVEVLESGIESISYTELRTKLGMKEDSFSRLLRKNKDLISMLGYESKRVGREKYLLRRENN